MDTVTAAEAARTLGVTVGHIYKLKQTGQIRTAQAPVKGITRSSCLLADDVRALIGRVDRSMKYNPSGSPVSDAGFTMRYAGR